MAVRDSTAITLNVGFAVGRGNASAKDCFEEKETVEMSSYGVGMEVAKSSPQQLA